MPSDMLREIWLGLKRFWSLRWMIKGPILVGLLGLIVAVVIFFVFFAEIVPTGGEVDRTNEELLASLPLYPGATLIGKYRFDDYREVVTVFGNTHRENFRTLTHVYAHPADTTTKEVPDFYRLELQKADWEPRPGEFDGPDTFFRDDYGYLYVIPLGPDLRPVAPAPEALLSALLEEPATPIAAPPAGSVTFFAISVAQLAR